MHGHRVRRRPRDAESPAVAEPPLRQGVSNRALVQRLAWKDGNLVVPQAYGERRIPWNKQYVEDREPDGKDHTFAKWVEVDPNFREVVQDGLGVEWFQATPVKPANDGQIKGSVAKLLDPAKKTSALAADRQLYAGMVEAAAAATAASNQLLVVPDTLFGDLASIKAAQRYVLEQDDYLPGKPDLPPKGTDLLKTMIDDPDADIPQSYYTYTCVLIALLQDSGFDATEALPEGPKVPKNLHKAVHALHDYYVDKRKLQYDDGGARMKIMGEWKYSLLWTGNARWTELPGQVPLAPGAYIADIDGHTLKLTVRKQIQAGTNITSIGEFFVDHSEHDNWDLSKTFNEATRVKAIWKR